MLTITKWYLLPFLLVAVLAYHSWYNRLNDRAFGYLYNAMIRHDQFVLAQVSFGIVGAGGLMLFQLFRKSLPRWMRVVYFALITSAIVFFAVDWIVILFGPKPFWHHP